MQIIEKDLMVTGEKCGTFLAYTDIEPELTITAETPLLTRVLPSQFFFMKGLHFFLIKRFEPGEHKYFPKGGFRVRSELGALRSYDLDQLVIHPSVIKHQKTLDKMQRRAEKEAKKRERQLKKANRPIKRKTGIRGRPALDPEEKARREALKIARTVRSGGKRGRPASTGPKKVKALSGAKGKRGRPKLTPEAIAAKVAAKAVIKARSGGKRGRPKKIVVDSQD